MAAKKTELMAQFYEQCQKKGYTDMQDEVQSLKAKVIAVDLGLNYKDITVFYEKAKECYRQVQEERAEAEKQRKIREQEEQAEAARRAVDGMLLVTINPDDKKQLRICLRPDGTFYTEIDKLRIEGAPIFEAQKGGSVQYTYNPSKTVFTGAASGNVAMGGTHQTKSSYSQSFSSSDKGYINAKLQESVFTVTSITLSQYIQNRFHRDPVFQRFAQNGYISCTRFSDTANMLARSAVSGSGNIYSQMSLLTMAADEKRIPYGDCVEIVKLLRRVASGDFPPTDGEVYVRAAELARRSSSADLKRAMEAFREISDYKDASQQIRLLQERYEEVLQTEKEQAILSKEAAEKKRKSQLKKMKARVLVCTVVLILVVAALTVLTNVVIPGQNYEDAATLLSNGQYEEALAAFEALGDFKDSAAKVLECEEGIRAADYAAAEEQLASGEFFQAATAFYRLGDYRDAWDRCMTIWGKITRRECISASSKHTVGLKEDGTVVAVGSDFYDQCSDVSQWQDIVAVSAGSSYSLGLQVDGTVKLAGFFDSDYIHREIASWQNVVTINASHSYAVALRADGTVENIGRYITQDTDSWQDIVAISAGGEHIVGLQADGTVVTKGRTHEGQCEVSGWSDIAAVSAGDYCTVGLRADGTVMAVGQNDDGQCNVSEWTDIAAISAGTWHTVGLKEDGTVVAVGQNDDGQCNVSEWTDIVAISAGQYHTVGLKADGTVVATECTGTYTCDGQCNVSGWSDIKIPE